jgi:hypothetical protein
VERDSRTGGGPINGDIMELYRKYTIFLVIEDLNLDYHWHNLDRKVASIEYMVRGNKYDFSVSVASPVIDGSLRRNWK